jgi:hypothetical protein
MDIWYILWIFGINFPVLVFCTEKNLATLVEAAKTIKICFHFYRFTAQKPTHTGVLALQDNFLETYLNF